MRAFEVVQTGYVVSRVTNLLSGFREESVGWGGTKRAIEIRMPV